MDYDRLIDEIVTWMQHKLQEAHARGFVFGLSGGVDSAVVAGLARRAAGGGALAVWMPIHSLAEDEAYARQAAEALQVELITVDLWPAYEAMIAALPSSTAMAAANIKPRLRMTTLYCLAQSRGCLVSGTGNRSEIMVGYFTKHGDSGVDLLPLGGLYKHEVYALAERLGVPQPIIERAPTAGLWPGQTDEGEMGITYVELDAILAAWDAGRKPDLPADRVARVKIMVERSEHKRHMAPVFPVTR